jgi:AcrR family transcriptional regulator
MFNCSQNPRVHRSLAKIATSLYGLLREKDYAKITITEVCDKAGVTRKTFYRNFSTLDDVIDFSISSRLEEAAAGSNARSIEDLLRVFFTLAYSKKENLALIEKQNLFYLYLRYSLAFLEKSPFFTRELAHHENPAYATYFYDAVAGAEMLILRKWVRGGFQETPDELVKVNLEILRTPAA